MSRSIEAERHLHAPDARVVHEIAPGRPVRQLVLL
jgi:hypothetical protein